MSAAVAPLPAVIPTVPDAPPKKTAANFDFDGLFDQARRELLDLANLAGVPHDAPLDCEHAARAQLLFAAEARWSVHYAWTGDTRDGYVNVANSTKRDSKEAARTAMIEAVKAKAAAPATWERLRHEIRSDPYQIFRSPEGELPLGEVRERFHAFARCEGCKGHGSVRCCMTGGWPCQGCGGRRQKRIISQGVAMWVNCYDCNVTGWITCPHCNGAKRVSCADCSGEGGHTHSWKATLTGRWTSDLTPEDVRFPDGNEKALAWPRATLFEHCFISTLEWGSDDAPNVARCRMAIPFQKTRFALTHLGKREAFKIAYLGRGFLPTPMPPVLDAVIAPYVARIERSAGAAAFAVARETAFGEGLLGSVLTSPTPGAVVSQVFKGTISAETAERVMRALDREAARVTRAPMRRAWLATNVAALLTWATIAALYGDLLRARLGGLHADANPLLVLAGAACLALFAGAGRLASRHAARKALSAMLKEPVTRAPDPGRTGLIGALGILLIVGCAILGFAPH
jgi:hypothetical protein